MRTDESQLDAVEEVLGAVFDDVLRHTLAAQPVERVDAALPVESDENASEVEYDVFDVLHKHNWELTPWSVPYFTTIFSVRTSPVGSTSRRR